MQNWFMRMAYKFANFMRGRRGNDEFGNFIVGVSIILMFISFFNLQILWYIALALLVYWLFRMFSKNIPMRARENEVYLKLTANIRSWFNLQRKRWRGRKTTKYFKCKKCGSVYSLPKGKGKLKAKCPSCGEQAIHRT